MITGQFRTFAMSPIHKLVFNGWTNTFDIFYLTSGADTKFLSNWELLSRSPLPIKDLSNCPNFDWPATCLATLITRPIIVCIKSKPPINNWADVVFSDLFAWQDLCFELMTLACEETYWFIINLIPINLVKFICLIRPPTFSYSPWPILFEDISKVYPRELAGR